MKILEIEQYVDLPDTHKTVLAVLRKGMAQAITTADIQRLTGFKDRRIIYEIIEQLVVKYGCVIGASRTGEFKGYYLISSQKELQDSLYSYNVQIQSMLKRHQKLRENYINQLEMEL